MSNEHVKRLIENNLDYAELLLVPEPSDLILINKDAGLGNISSKQQALLNSWFNSLHRLQPYSKPKEIIIQIVKDPDTQQKYEIPINPHLYSKDVIKEKLKDKTLIKKMVSVPKYPHAFQDLKSRISSMLITSGSLEGFKAELQHSSITKQRQEQTLEEINPLKSKKKRGDKK